jgi:glycosyltransferase involved in cell wall biosynthesis
MSAPAMSAPPLAELVILTPTHAPAGTGAARYTGTLVEMLLAAGVAGRIVVLTEAHPGQPTIETTADGRLRIERRFPHRAGCAHRQRDRHLRYAWQNLMLTGLLRRDWPTGAALLVHGSLHIHAGLLGPVIRRLRGRASRPRLIADLRDPRLPPRRQAVLAAYDAVIGGGAAVTAALHPRPGHLHEIPIPLQPPAPPRTPAAVANDLGLAPGRYVLWTNGVLRRKNLDLALDAMQVLRRTAAPDAVLAVAGGARDWSRAHTAAARAGCLRYLGPVPADALLALAAAAGVVLNVSPVEGLPRAALEAIAVGAPVLLPPGVPEFAHHCPHHLADTRGPEPLAAQLARALAEGLPPAPYPLAGHLAAAVAPAYRVALCGG